MLTNYLKIAFRNLLNNRVYSFINVAGLSVGMTVSILILIFVVHEYSYDHFHKNGDLIFRAEKQFSRDGRHSLYANPEFGPTMMATNPKVANYVRTFSGGRKVVKSDNQHKFFEERFIFADSSFFGVFTFPLIKGERSSLSRPLTVVITEATAIRYFGDVDPMGKLITFDSDYLFEVTGVAKNPPTNSSVQFDFIASFPSLLTMPKERDMVLNNSSGFPTYLLLKQSGDIANVQQSILKTNYTNNNVIYSLAPLFSNHFNLNFGDTANTRYVFIFLCVALLILFLALINYMNLTTARATARAKEVGIRKVIGASKSTLSWQFYLESAITTIISFGLANILIQLFKPTLLTVLQQNIDTAFLTSPLFVGVVCSLLVSCVMVAGSYPALILPQFKALAVLSGRFSNARQGSKIRKILTVFQFTVSVALVICSLVMNSQLDYLQSKETGLHREEVMVVPIDRFTNASLTAFKTELHGLAGVEKMAVASVPIYHSPMSGIALITSPVSQEKGGAKWIVVDDEFLSVLSIPWLEKPESVSFSGNHILNESAAVAFGMVNQPLGQDLTMGGDHVPAINGKIVGVVKDFNYETLRSKIQPLIISIVDDSLLNKSYDPSLYIRIGGSGGWKNKIAAVKRLYEKFAGEAPFSYYFLDDAFNELQKGEDRLSSIFVVFTGISLCIACLGLFGLVTFTAETRTKEISIRKVLGASVINILSLLSKDFILLLIISIGCGVPLAWFVMQDWLSNFYYRTDIPVAMIAVPCVAVVFIAVMVIFTKVIRVALENPSNNLKSE